MDRYFEYLDRLRESGDTNMFGAGKYLEEEFSLSTDEAHEILVEWIKTFSDRHPEG